MMIVGKKLWVARHAKILNDRHAGGGSWSNTSSDIPTELVLTFLLERLNFEQKEKSSVKFLIIKLFRVA